MHVDDPPWGIFFGWQWSYFVEIQKTTNHCIIYDGDRVHGY